MKRKIEFIAIFSTILAIATGPTSVGAATAPSSESALSPPQQHEDTVLECLRPVLYAAKKAGRLYYVCDDSTGKFPVPFPKVRVRAPSKNRKGLEAVREIFRDDKRVIVSEESDGIIRIYIGKVPAQILQTKISLLKLKRREQYMATWATFAITNTKEVQAAMDKLGVQLPVNVYSIPMNLPRKEEPHLPASMRDLTMEQALDAVARTFGVLVVYGECANQTGAHFINVDAIERFSNRQK